MAKRSVKFEDFPHRITSGDLLLKELALTGWGTSASVLRTKTDKGRLWGRITTGNVFELWTTPDFADPLKRVAYSAAIAAAGTITLLADNASGITGSAFVSYTLGNEQLFDCIVSPASEEDLERLYKSVAGELTSTQYAGQGVRFEALQVAVMRTYIWPWVWERYAEDLGVDDRGRPNVAHVAAPEQLKECHALKCIAEIYKRRAGLHPEFATLARDYAKLAWDEFDKVPLAIDAEPDEELDSLERPERWLDR